MIDFFFGKKISSTIGNGANNTFYESPSAQDGEAKQNGWMSYKYEDTKKNTTPKGCLKRFSCFHDLTSSSSSSSSSSASASSGSNNMVGMSRYPSRDESTKTYSTRSVGTDTFTTQLDSSSKSSSSRENRETDFQKGHSIFINQLRTDDHSTHQPDSDLFYTFKF